MYRFLSTLHLLINLCSTLSLQFEKVDISGYYVTKCEKVQGTVF